MDSRLLVFALLAVRQLTCTEYSPQSCADTYYRYTPTHTACIKKESTPNGHVDWTSITDADRQHIVSRHNYYRGNVHLFNRGKKASNMLPISYDRELENLAQIWAANCIFSHDESNNRYVPGKYNTGQNLALGAQDWDGVLELWHSEVQTFSYGTGPTSSSPIGHYTQMVWAESTRVGCGLQLCNGTNRFYVCNYAPTGNIANRIHTPYQVGQVSQDCPLKYNSTNGLCECPQSLCYNEGTVDTKSCTCKCPRARWLQQDNCAMMCGRAEDHPTCERWDDSYCRLYTNVKAEYCPFKCNVCHAQGPPVPVLSTVRPTTPEPLTTRLQAKSPTTSPPTSTTATTAASGSPQLSKDYCTKEEPALCGQPNSRTGYLPPSVCLSAETAKICPAMCGLCAARSCRDYSDTSYNVGESWINMYGRFTCTHSGVHFERGCQTEDRKDIVAVDSNRIIKYENHTYSCTCDSEESPRLVNRLHCTPVEEDEVHHSALEPCDRIEGARCGLPVVRGRYWHKSHCSLRMVRRLCPAMCKLCTARGCRLYNRTVVDVGTEFQDNKNNMYACNSNGWSIGPSITIDSINHSTTASVFVVRHGASMLARITTTSTQLPATTRQRMPPTTQPPATTRQRMPPTTQPLATTRQRMPPTTQPPATTRQRMPPTTQPPATTRQRVPPTTQPPATTRQRLPPTTQPPSTTRQRLPPTTQPPSTTRQKLPPTTQVPTSSTTSRLQSFIELFNQAVDDPYADDYLDNDDESEEVIDIDIPGPPTTYQSSFDDGSGDIQEFVDVVSEPTNLSPIASKPTSTLSSSSPATDVQTTPREVNLIESTTPLWLFNTLRKRTEAWFFPTTSVGGNTPVVTSSTSPKPVHANQYLIDNLFPNTSAQCILPDQAYCNQPLPGNTTLTFTREDCVRNPLLCPGLCRLCQVTTCQDYSKQTYSVGETWHSQYARLTCTKHGVSAQRGCYYDMLRMFIDSGDSLHHEDGFLTHDCTCDVTLHQTMWTHDLKCTTSVSSSQRITVAPQAGLCVAPDDHRCVDPYYTESDCISVHVSTICGALCGKCTATHCSDSRGKTHQVGQSWISSFGKNTCTKKGLRLARGCRFTQQNVFIEVGTNYSYSFDGVVYTCTCDKTSEYRYQLTCEGQRRRSYSRGATTTASASTTRPLASCQRVDNPKCGQQSPGLWKEERCSSRGRGWQSFMYRVCPALCGLCTAQQCQGYDRKIYQLGGTWVSFGVRHICTPQGIKQI